MHILTFFYVMQSLAVRVYSLVKNSYCIIMICPCATLNDLSTYYSILQLCWYFRVTEVLRFHVSERLVKNTSGMNWYFLEWARVFTPCCRLLRTLRCTAKKLFNCSEPISWSLKTLFRIWSRLILLPDWIRRRALLPTWFLFSLVTLWKVHNIIVHYLSTFLCFNTNFCRHIRYDLFNTSYIIKVQ